MGLLDDAIREHLDLKRRHGANESEVARQEAEALGPVVREEGEVEESGSAPPGAAEAELSLPYDRAAEAGLTGEADLPSFEWHGSSTAEPEVPSFVSPEPLRGTEAEPDGVESRGDAEDASDLTEAFDVAEDDPALEEPEVAVEPEVLDPEPPTAYPRPSEPEGPFDPEPGAEPGVSFEPPAEPVLPEEPIERPIPAEAEDRLAEARPLDDETAFEPAPIEEDLAASPEPEPEPVEPVLGLGTEASEAPVVPPPEELPPEDDATAFHPAVFSTPEPAAGDVEDVPPEPAPVPPEAAPLPLEAEEPPPEREPPPLTAGEVVEEPPIDVLSDEPSIEEPPVGETAEPRVEQPPLEDPFVAGEEEAWRESGEAPGDISDSLPEPPLGGASPLDPHPVSPVDADPLLEPADEPPVGEAPLPRPAPDAELASPEPLDGSLDESLDTPAEPPPPSPGDPEAARGFFDETAEYERPRHDERSPTVDPDFED